jgi:hypothetical protein
VRYQPPGIAVGPRHSCALTRSGGVKCWGDNSSGQLGNGTTTSSPTPVDVTGLGSGVEAVAVGWRHACALVTGGTVKCWGTMGTDGAAVMHSTPVDVLGLPNGQNAIASISAGYDYTCARVTYPALKVRCWGLNDHGQLGNGTTISSSVPVEVVSLTSGAVFAGGKHTCALASVSSGDGSFGPNRDVKCWGDNRYGQLGDGTTVNSTVPVKVTGIRSDAFASAVAVGGDHTCASTDSGVVCWGRNVDGQAGNGTTIDSRSPVMVSGFSTFAPIDAAPFGDHTCALIGGFGVKCWGNNDFGQLGNGTTISSSVPVEVDLRVRPKVDLRSSIPAGTIDRETIVTFTATVRPVDQAGARPVVRFVIFRQDEDGAWRSAASRDVTADATGKAHLRWTFVTPGVRLVRARVLPDAAYAASSRSLPVTYTVR